VEISAKLLALDLITVHIVIKTERMKLVIICAKQKNGTIICTTRAVTAYISIESTEIIAPTIKSLAQQIS